MHISLKIAILTQWIAFSFHSGWVSAIHTSLIAPNFTEYGWAVTRSPEVSYNILKICEAATICQLTKCLLGIA